jgi:outer membrane protein TolC
MLARNPSLAEMVAAWQAASARFPQVTSLDDPNFGATLAPASLGSNQVDTGYRLEIAQKYPWCGKLALRGANAQAEASAAGRDVDDMRLQLVESAQSAFYDYYLVDRALAVNEEALRLLREFRRNAETRYRTGQVVQQDVLQADVELGRQQERQITLERMREVAVARINTLMHVPTRSPLPPPPGQLQLAGPLPDAQQLQAVALARRPDLQALANRIEAEEASLGLAHKEFCPDFEVMAAYDSIMGNGPTRDLAPQVAVRMNLPVRKARRYGAIAEAEARLSQRRAALDRQRDQVSLQVEEAHAQVRESERVVWLYEKEVLPAARNNVKAAQAAYTTGRIPFLSLIEAQRNVVNLQDRYYEAIADYFRRRAALERAVGGSLVPVPPDGGPTPPDCVR